MTDAIKILEASRCYSDLLSSFSSKEKLKVDLNKRELSEALYFHICKMKYAGWRHRINFGRHRKHSFSDFFQDIVAFYLRASLPKDYEVELEPKQGTIQPDIAIKRGNKYVFVVEVKTNVGYRRLNENTEEGVKAIKEMKTRCESLVTNFAVAEQRVIYIFEEPTNVSRVFEAKYWLKSLHKPTPGPTTLPFPYSIIYPLFYGTDPYYWTWEKGFDPSKNYKQISDEEIQKRGKDSIVTPFEEILKLIQKS